MASLISDSEKAVLTGIFDSIFDTFSRRIVIYKESTKIPITDPDSSSFLFGFGENQAEDVFTYVEVTGVYPAVIRYKHQNIELGHEITAYAPLGEVSIKVREDCRNFINNGKTQRVVFDDKTFILDAEEQKQNFLDSNFWIFKLKTVK
jgi:hypothetical protein